MHLSLQLAQFKMNIRTRASIDFVFRCVALSPYGDMLSKGLDRDTTKLLAHWRFATLLIQMRTREAVTLIEVDALSPSFSLHNNQCNLKLSGTRSLDSMLFQTSFSRILIWLRLKVKTKNKRVYKCSDTASDQTVTKWPHYNRCAS